MKFENQFFKEIEKYLNWKEKLIMNIFKKTFIKIYKLGISFGFNNK